MKIGRRGFLGSLVAAASLPVAASKVVAQPPAPQPSLPVVYGAGRLRPPAPRDADSFFSTGLIGVDGAWYLCRKVSMDIGCELIEATPMGMTTSLRLPNGIMHPTPTLWFSGQKSWALTCEIPAVMTSEKLGQWSS